MMPSEAERIAAAVEARFWQTMAVGQTMTREEYRAALSRYILETANAPPPPSADTYEGFLRDHGGPRVPMRGTAITKVDR